ncbi:dimethylallyl tryptophan synthase [Penicillium mononematosum]|uniref:dimethylallyl tryptophan synthase n=1 Tax=Penicillium mononematosum TaxID=268346 RepID=UPI0025479C5C|nr:dimethylallyl tryptophan synthase [Penicillium mononematosum]KAJ6186274.1 dimethylallyl tryptophan synthase [Penicillium mononematosum]
MTLLPKTSEAHVAERPHAILPMPWRILGQALGFPNHDQELWWLHTSPFFNKLLIQCGYDIHLQYQYLCFYHRHIISVLGPFIRSGMEPDYLSGFTPEGYGFELSVNHQLSGSVLRLGCEPQSEFAGTEHDRLNQYMARELLGRLARLDDNIDLRWFNHFDSHLSLTHEEANAAAPHLVRHRWQTKVLAFDLKNGAVLPKAYFFLKAKSIVTGIPIAVLAFGAIEHLDKGFEPGISVLKRFLSPCLTENPSESNASEILLIAVDCVVPSNARLKLYVANTQLCLDSIRHFWTLGGYLRDPVTVKGLAIAEKLWSFLRLDEASRSHTDVDHLPLVLNYGLEIGGETVRPQLYLPSHGQNDDSGSDGLADFFRYLKWENLATRYKQELIQNL